MSKLRVFLGALAFTALGLPAAASSIHVAPVSSGLSAAALEVQLASTPGGRCMRLPLSDIQFGREYTIKIAREKLEEYAKEEAARRGWKGPLTRSNETVSCEDYLWLPIGGQEYRFLVTATYCRR